MAGRTRKSFDWKALYWYTAVKWYFICGKVGMKVFRILWRQNIDLERAVRGVETKYYKDETCNKENTVSLSIRGVSMTSS